MKIFKTLTFAVMAAVAAGELRRENQEVRSSLHWQSALAAECFLYDPLFTHKSLNHFNFYSTDTSTTGGKLRLSVPFVPRVKLARSFATH